MRGSDAKFSFGQKGSCNIRKDCMERIMNEDNDWKEMGKRGVACAK